MTESENGWLEAAIAWEVCASLHRQYCKGKDALFATRQSDFVKHAEAARLKATAAPQQEAQSALFDKQGNAPVPRDWFPVDGNTRGYKGDIVLRHYKQKDQYRLGHTNWIGDREVTPYSPSGTAKPVAAWKGTIEDMGLDAWMPLGDFAAQAAPADLAGPSDDLVTRESAMQALDHVAIHNSDTRERDAYRMLSAAQAAQEPSHQSTQLAEMILSDCGFSSNYTPLLNRVAARIDAHVERCLESKKTTQQEAQSL